MAEHRRRQDESERALVRRRRASRWLGFRIDRPDRGGCRGGETTWNSGTRGSAATPGPSDPGCDRRIWPRCRPSPGQLVQYEWARGEHAAVQGCGAAPEVPCQPETAQRSQYESLLLGQVLRCAGYTEFDDIDHGSAVQTGDFPDYVLRSGGKPVIAVEAKRIDHSLGPKEAGQVVKYCSVLGLRWGLLTNGRLLQLYDAPVTGVMPEDRLVLEIDMNDWADREDF